MWFVLLSIVTGLGVIFGVIACFAIVFMICDFVEHWKYNKYVYGTIIMVVFLSIAFLIGSDILS